MGREVRLKFIPLLGLIDVTICAGAYGMETLVSESGPGLAFLLIPGFRWLDRRLRGLWRAVMGAGER